MKHNFTIITSILVFFICFVGSSIASANDASYEILENGAGKFRVEVDGIMITEAVKITVEDLVIDEREMSTGADWDYRVYGPGDAHFGSITIRARMGSNSKELFQWWQDTSRGQNIRKDISVIALKRDGSEARRFNILNTFPISFEFDPMPDTTGSEFFTLEAEIGSITLECLDQTDESGDISGLDEDLEVAIEGVTTANWESWRGGEEFKLKRGIARRMQKSDFHQTTPGHKYIDTLTLRGPLTSGRKAMCDWINAVVQGKDWKRTVAVKPMSQQSKKDRTFLYSDSFPTRYVFPAFSSSGTGNLYEEVAIKPIRLEIH